MNAILIKARTPRRGSSQPTALLLSLAIPARPTRLLWRVAIPSRVVIHAVSMKMSTLCHLAFVTPGKDSDMALADKRKSS